MTEHARVRYAERECEQRFPQRDREMRINLSADEPFDHDLDHLQRASEKERRILGARLRNENRLGHP